MRSLSAGKILAHSVERIAYSQKLPASRYPLPANAFLFLIFILCLFYSESYAAPCYGVNLPEKKQFFSGVQSHTIFKRYLEDNFGKVRSAQYFLLVSYGVLDWLSVDLKIGAGDIKQHPVGSDEVDYASGFAGGYGFRLKLLDRGNFKTAFGFQHISVHPKGTHLGFVKNKAILDDWQYSLLAGYDFSRKSGIPPSIKQWAGKKFTFYLGGRWSRVDYIHRVDTSRKRRMSDLTKSAGLAFGADIPIREKFFINLEGSVFDSEAVAFSLNYKF